MKEDKMSMGLNVVSKKSANLKHNLFALIVQIQETRIKNQISVGEEWLVKKKVTCLSLSSMIQ